MDEARNDGIFMNIILIRDLHIVVYVMEIVNNLNTLRRSFNC